MIWVAPIIISLHHESHGFVVQPQDYCSREVLTAGATAEGRPSTQRPLTIPFLPHYNCTNDYSSLIDETLADKLDKINCQYFDHWNVTLIRSRYTTTTATSSLVHPASLVHSASRILLGFKLHFPSCFYFGHKVLNSTAFFFHILLVTRHCSPLALSQMRITFQWSKCWQFILSSLWASVRQLRSYHGYS